MNYLNENVNELLFNFEERLGKAVAHVKAEFSMVRAGRVSTGLVERINVDYFGEPTPIRNLGNITASDSRTIVINLWDTAILREVCKALTLAQLGANPIDDGRVIRLIFPILTKERREELKKQVKKIAEEGKVAIRNERKNTMDGLKRISKDDNISEDEVETIKKDVEKLTGTYTESLDKLLANKESEILEI
ncbi:MAG: ribosome recycling factor [Firmicutes bacterium]|nr:ribosome recycling factor [Bacillota bacterium]